METPPNPRRTAVCTRGAAAFILAPTSPVTSYRYVCARLSVRQGHERADRGVQLILVNPDLIELQRAHAERNRLPGVRRRAHGKQPPLPTRLLKAHQLRRRDSERTRKPADVHKTDVPMASFDVADVAPGDPALASQLLL